MKDKTLCLNETSETLRKNTYLSPTEPRRYLVFAAKPKRVLLKDPLDDWRLFTPRLSQTVEAPLPGSHPRRRTLAPPTFRRSEEGMGLVLTGGRRRGRSGTSEGAG